MFALERIAFAPKGQRPRYHWRRVAVCGNPGLLQRVRQGQKRPSEWRVVPIPAMDVSAELEKAG